MCPSNTLQGAQARSPALLTEGGAIIPSPCLRYARRPPVREWSTNSEPWMGAPRSLLRSRASLKVPQSTSGGRD
jgi:hypothetical protein